MNTTLFETLAIKQGQILNKDYHNQRFIKGQKLLACPNIITDIGDLIDMNNSLIANQISNQTNQQTNHLIIRCRVTYCQDNYQVAYFDYTPKTIRSFKLVECDNIDYAYKYDDRNLLNNLLNKKQQCDEIIIVKNNFITDCSIGNLLFLKNEQWFTPNTPLLQGTQRQYLLDSGKIQLASITKDNLSAYQKVMMINALNGFDERRAVAIDCVIGI